jgi:hypothetical protein
MWLAANSIDMYSMRPQVGQAHRRHSPLRRANRVQIPEKYVTGSPVGTARAAAASRRAAPIRTPLGRSRGAKSTGFCGTARRVNRKTRSCCYRSPKRPKGRASAGRAGRSTRRTERPIAPRLVRREGNNWLLIGPFRRVFGLHIVVLQIDHRAAGIRSTCEIRSSLYGISPEDQCPSFGPR